MLLLCNVESPEEVGGSGKRIGVGAGIVAAAITVPAHGFIVNSGGIVHATAPITGSAGMGWMKTFLGACVWAFMIAAGSLVYSHFVEKWQEKGYPMLPVAALAAGGSQSSPVQGIPLPGGHSSQSRGQMNHHRAASGAQTQAPQGGPPSYLDQYEG